MASVGAEDWVVVFWEVPDWVVAADLAIVDMDLVAVDTGQGTAGMDLVTDMGLETEDTDLVVTGPVVMRQVDTDLAADRVREEAD